MAISGADVFEVPTIYRAYVKAMWGAKQMAPGTSISGSWNSIDKHDSGTVNGLDIVCISMYIHRMFMAYYEIIGNLFNEPININPLRLWFPMIPYDTNWWLMGI